MMGFFVGLFSSVVFIGLILLTVRYHSWVSYDNLGAIQKYHTEPTARIGGIAVFIGFWLAIICNQQSLTKAGYGINIITSVILVFIIGALEDLTKRIPPIVRMAVFTISAFGAMHITHVLPIITYADFYYLECLIKYCPMVGMLLSWFCVVGLTNSYNIIDGYNGLSATTAMINLIGLAVIAYLVHDIEIFRLSILFCAAILGFWIFNYPWGKIFLGDGGAYTIGFVIAVLSIYLVHHHKGLISPYSVLLMAIYPITEMGFSMYRRKFIHRTSGMQPDNMHLHQLIYHQCVPEDVKNRNARVMPLMLFFMIPPVVLSVIFYQSTAINLSLLVLYIIFYSITYVKLTRFMVPKFLKIML